METLTVRAPDLTVIVLAVKAEAGLTVREFPVVCPVTLVQAVEGVNEVMYVPLFPIVEATLPLSCTFVVPTGKVTASVKVTVWLAVVE